MDWFHPLPLTGSVAQRTRNAAERGSPKVRVRNRIAIRKPEHAFYKAFSTTLALNGYRVKTATRYQIAKLFNVSIPTILKWEKAGVLPVPVMYKDRGSSQIPIYLSSQVRCLILVVNDIIQRGGYLSIPWAYLKDHVAMLHVGYEQAVLNFQRRAGYFDEEPLGDEVRPDKFGVRFS